MMMTMRVARKTMMTMLMMVMTQVMLMMIYKPRELALTTKLTLLFSPFPMMSIFQSRFHHHFHLHAEFHAFQVKGAFVAFREASIKPVCLPYEQNTQAR